MSKLITGPLQSGKTTYIFDEIRDRIRREESDIIILVPEQSTMMYERAALCALGNGAAAHVEILSFVRFARLMFSRYAAAGGVYASAASKQLIMSLAVSGVSEALTVFRGAAHKSEFARAMTAAVNDLKTYNITPERMRSASERCESERTSQKLKDAALIYSAYEAHIGRAYKDPSDDLTRLARLMSSLSSLPGTFYVDGFFGFTPHEYLVLEELIRLCGDITVTVSYDEARGGSGLFSMTKNTFKKICALFERYDNAPEIIKTGTEKKRPRELKILCEAFVSEKTETYEGAADAIEVVSSPNVRAEAEYLCDWITKRVQLGARYSDFLVLCADMSGYELTLSRLFEKYSIPLYADKKKSVSDMAPARALTGALSAASKKYAYSELFGFLKLLMGNYTYEEICAFENYVLMWDIKGEKLTRPFTKDPFSRRRKQKSDDEEERARAEAQLSFLNDIRARVMGPLSKLSGALGLSKTCGEAVEAVFTFMEESGFFEAAERLSREYSEEGDIRRADEYQRICGAVTEALYETAETLSDSPCTAGGFIKLFELALSEHKLGALPPAADCVTLSSFDRVISPNAPYVAIIGASDDNIPKISMGGGLFDEAEREELKSIGLEISKSAYENANYELFLVYAALSAPSKELLITYPLSSDGSETKASRVLSSAYAALSALKEKRESDIPLKERLYSKQKAKELVFSSLSGGASGEDGAVLSAAAEILGEDEGWQKWEEHVKKYVFSGNEAKIFSPANRAAMINRDTVLTASRIEKYYSCRFAYYMNYVLDIKKPERSDFAPTDTGTFVHYILESFFIKIMKGKKSLGEYGKKEIESLIGECVKEYLTAEIYLIDERSARFRYLFSHLVRSLSPIIENLTEELKVSSFVPEGFERKISATISPAENKDDGVRLFGVVDRIDVYRNDGKTYLRVIDYKTGKKTFELSDVVYGLNMQMLLYLFALTEHYKKITGDAESAGALYFHAYEPVVRAPKSISEDELLKMRRKEFKRNGLIRSDRELIEAMDNMLREKKDSRYIPVSYDKDMEPKDKTSVASKEEFAVIEKGVKRAVLEMRDKLSEGSIEIAPFGRSRDTSYCRFCEYKSVCRFDEGRGNKTRKPARLTREQVYKILGGESIGGELD
ncbi:MAG: PD-(D/E)XK nuclease family protein [Clostridia bacterium]|nr:PD-(D/E)XK nuclease family protein [Clostridia bacterium]